MAEQIPLARPDLGAREQELVLEVLRSGQLSLGPKLGEFEDEFASWLGSDDAVAVSSGTAALHLGVRRLGWGEGDEVLTTPVHLRRLRQLPALRGRDAGLLRHRPGHAQHRPGQRAAGGRRRRRPAGILPVHIFGYPADLIALEGIADDREIPILEDACQALGRRRRRGPRGRHRRAPRRLRLLRQQADDDGGGRRAGPRRRGDGGGAAQRAQPGPLAGHVGQLDHERIGFNYRMTDIQAAIGIAQVERLDEMLAARANVARLYGERLGAIGGAAPGRATTTACVLPCADRGDERRSWFVYAVQLPADADRDAVIEALGRRGHPVQGLPARAST